MKTETETETLLNDPEYACTKIINTYSALKEAAAAVVAVAEEKKQLSEAQQLIKQKLATSKFNEQVSYVCVCV